ncbi:MAG TPA: SulP family inorganic anion transporter [Patescibacteria group bacterium]|nr:SulP family inorganic anion transporter [Patescibacteria group bacterium]
MQQTQKRQGFFSSLRLTTQPTWIQEAPTFADFRTGFIVSMLSVTFALSVSNASNFPASAGFITAIISGIICTYFGGANLGITGMAAGLAPLLAKTVTSLGGGVQGYQKTQVGVVLVGLLMILSSYVIDFKRIFNLVPHVVLAGMLGGIGIGLIIKQSAHARVNSATFAITLTCLIMIFAMERFAQQRDKRGASSSSIANFFWKLPPQIFAIPIGICMASLFMLDVKYKVAISGSLADAISLPDFAGVVGGGWHDIKIVVLFAISMYFIDSLEHVSTARAMARKDTQKREVVDNLSLRGAGYSNFVGALIGGATTIIGGIKTTCSWVLGAQTNWCNLFNACFLLFWWIIGRDVLAMIPYAALAAVLMHAAWKLVSPITFFRECHTWLDAVAFIVTAIVTYKVDLLVGVVAGMVVVVALRKIGASVFHQTLPRLLAEPAAETE